MAAAVFRLGALALLCAGCTTVVIDQRTFDGTQWRVFGIDRAPIRAEAGYRMDFLGSRWHGGFGCNGMSAEYRVRGNILEVGRSEAGQFRLGEVMATERDCSSSPDGHFEGDALAILRRPMEIRFRGKRHLVLSNASGSIDLEMVR